MKKEPIVINVSTDVYDAAESLNIDVQELVKEAFLRGVSHLRFGDMASLSGDVYAEEIELEKEPFLDTQGGSHRAKKIKQI